MLYLLFQKKSVELQKICKNYIGFATKRETGKILVSLFLFFLLLHQLQLCSAAGAFEVGCAREQLTDINP